MTRRISKARSASEIETAFKSVQQMRGRTTQQTNFDSRDAQKKGGGGEGKNERQREREGVDRAEKRPGTAERNALRRKHVMLSRETRAAQFQCPEPDRL